MKEDAGSSAADQPDEKAAKGAPPDRRSDQVRIRLPGGEHAWVSADAFNLISEKEFRDSERLRRLRGQRNLAAAAAAVALLVTAAGLISVLTRGDRPAEITAEAGPTAGERAEGPPAETPPPTPEEQEVAAVVRGWAQAWSARDVEAVMAFYSPEYLVPDGMSRAGWEALLRQRVISPELLAVTVDDLQVEHTSPESASARLLLVYDTPGYRAWVTETLELALESGGWRISDEIASLVEVGVGSVEAAPAGVTRP